MFISVKHLLFMFHFYFACFHYENFALSLQTGRIKGYGFVEFQFEEVAKIVADTMNNYLMFERLLKCKALTSHHT